jgi:hypothetical protein
MKLIFTLHVIFSYLFIVYAYKPVFLMHGIMTGSLSMDLIKTRIEEVSIFSLFFQAIAYYYFLIIETSRNSCVQY